MAAQPDALVGNAGRLASDDSGIIGNIMVGAQYGFSNHLDYLDSATPLALPPMRPIVTHAPTMFNYLPNFTSFFKNFIERHIHTFDGVPVQYSNAGTQMLNFADSQQPTMPTDTHRTPIEPNVTCQEVIGNCIWQFHRYWMWMIKDPDTSGASLAGIVPASQSLPPHVFSVFSGDLCCIQFDTTFRPENMIDAYFITAFWPNDIGDAGYRHEHGQTTVPERNISYHGVLQHNRNTAAAGRNIAEILNLHIPNADFATPVATTIESNIIDDGLRREVSRSASAYQPMGDNAAQV